MAIDTQSSDFLLGKNTANNPSSLVGTMVQPLAPSPSVLPPGPPPNTPGSDTAFASALDEMQTKFKYNNALMSNRNLILKQLYDRPLTSDEKAQLDPSFLDAINSGDQNRLHMALRLISDEVKGRTNSVDQSMKFLVDSYQKEQDRIEKQKQSSIDNVIQFATTYGKNAKSALTSLYGQDYVDQLKSHGIDLDKFSALSTVAEQKAGNNNSSDQMSLADLLVHGQMDPSQLSKRTANYNAILAEANRISMEDFGVPFNIATATRDYKFASQSQTQNTLKYLASLTGSQGNTGNLDALVKLSDSINRTDFPALNDVNAWTKLQTGDPQMAAYYATVTEVADQVAKILQGGGSGSGTSDAKLAQAASLFQAKFNKAQIKAVADSLRTLLSNRKRELIGKNIYLKDFADVEPTKPFYPTSTGNLTPELEKLQTSNSTNGTTSSGLKYTIIK